MKRTHTIFIFSVSDVYSELVQDIYCTYIDKTAKEGNNRYEDHTFAMTFYENTPYFDEIQSIFTKHSIEYKHWSKVIYTKTEMENAEFFLVILPNPLEHEGTNLTHYSNSFNENGELRLSDTVYVPEKFVKKQKFSTYPPGFILNEEIKNSIEEMGFTGIDRYIPVTDLRKKMPLPNYYPEFNSVLPPVNPSTLITYLHLNDSECINYLYSDLRYSHKITDNAKDFNVTFENFYNERMRLLVVSNRVRAFFKSIRLYALYEPVFFDDL